MANVTDFGQFRFVMRGPWSSGPLAPAVGRRRSMTDVAGRSLPTARKVAP